jgi:hypothetical protein
VSDRVNDILLNAEKIIVPFEEIRGDRQVSSLVALVGGIYTVYSLTENEKDIGPVKITRSDLTSDRIKVWLSEQEGQYAEVSPREVRITEWSFWHEGQIETVIYGIALLGSDGRALRLCREGAAYPYGLLLKDSSDVGEAVDFAKAR